MEKEKEAKTMMVCPVARFFSEMEKSCGKKSQFFTHFKQSQIEFLKALRSLMDERIEELEKKKAGNRKTATKIKVE
jgi:hypothetical protein